MSVPAGVTDKQTQPVFNIRLTLTDVNDAETFTQYDMTLVIVKDWEDPIIQIIQEAKKKEVINTYQGRVYDLGDTTIDDITTSTVPNKLQAPRYNVEQDYAAQLQKTEEDDEIANPTPKPKIGGVSNDGIVGIKFNTPMIVPDLSLIQNSQVALRTTQAISSTVETK